MQGGAANRGLFFAGPPPSPLGAVSGKISENQWAVVKNNGVNLAMGTSGPAVAEEIACCQITTQSFAQERIK